MKSIRSAANAEFKRWRRLAGNTRFMKAQGRTLAEGLHLARAALDAGHPVAAALVRAGASGAELEACLARIDAARVHELAPALFDALAPVERGSGLMLEVPFDRGSAPRRLAGDAMYLDGVQDPGNIGALLRVAAAAGVGAVLAAPTTAALWSPKALRAGQGAHFGLELVEDVPLETLDRWYADPWIGTAARDAVCSGTHACRKDRWAGCWARKVRAFRQRPWRGARCASRSRWRRGWSRSTSPALPPCVSSSASAGAEHRAAYLAS